MKSPRVPVPRRWARRQRRGAGMPAADRGFTLLELMLALALTSVTAVIGIAWTSSALDEIRAAMAARHLEGVIVQARIRALSRSTRVALRFEGLAGNARFTEYADGNGNGVRAADIAGGVDPLLAPAQSLGDLFSGVVLERLAGVPEIDGGPAASAADGVQVGSGRMLTLGPDGTATSGTLYVRGRRGQYAVRVLGATGRTRVLRFDWGSRQWTSR